MHIPPWPLSARHAIASWGARPRNQGMRVAQLVDYVNRQWRWLEFFEQGRERRGLQGGRDVVRECGGDSDAGARRIARRLDVVDDEPRPDLDRNVGLVAHQRPKIWGQ
jgi:hypothetical protein